MTTEPLQLRKRGPGLLRVVHGDVLGDCEAGFARLTAAIVHRRDNLTGKSGLDELFP